MPLPAATGLAANGKQNKQVFAATAQAAAATAAHSIALANSLKRHIPLNVLSSLSHPLAARRRSLSCSCNRAQGLAQMFEMFFELVRIE